MSTEYVSKWYQWDDPSFVSETPLCDAFMARECQQTYIPKLLTRRTKDTWTAQTFNEAPWLNGIIEDFKKNNAINIVRQWLHIFCGTWLHRDASFLDVIDDSTIEGFIRTHWALHTKSESERTLAERMMGHLNKLLGVPETLQTDASPSKKRHRGNGGPSYDDKAHPSAEWVPPAQQGVSLTAGTLVPPSGEPSKKKKRRRHAGPSHNPDAQKQGPEVETVLPPSQTHPLSPGAAAIPPIGEPRRKKRGRKPKQAKPVHDPHALQQTRQAEMSSQHVSPTISPPSFLPSHPIGVEISLDEDASLGWIKPPRSIPVPMAGRYPRSSSHVQNEDDNNRTLPTGAPALTPDMPPKGPDVTSHESDQMAPRKISPFITEQTLTRSRFAKRLDKVAPLQQTQKQPDDRPILAAEPQIWAENRSEVGESLEYFRRAQGGVHSKDNVATGYLLDGYPTNRDCCTEGGEVIISHGGGGMGSEKNEHGVVTAMKSDHNAAERSVKALLNAFKAKNPVAVIIGDRYRGFPFRLQTENQEYRFIVLGWYAITHAWAYPEANILTTAKVSKPGQATRYMFRFQWLNTQGTPWWRLSASMPASMPNVPDTNTQELPSELALDAHASGGHTAIPTDYGCGCCGRNSPLIFDRPLCLQPDCEQFDKEYFPPDLTYNAKFLRRLALDEPQYVISMPIEPSVPVPEDSTSRRAWDGLVCPTCHKLTQRLFWKGWFCTVCKTYPEFANHTLRDARDFSTLQLTTVRPSHPQFPVSTNPFRTEGEGVMYSGMVYTLPLKCKLYHLHPENGAFADDLFHQYQTDAQVSDLFVRCRLQNSPHGHVQVNRHFAFNVGETYNYSSIPTTVSLDDSPPCVSIAKNEISNVVLRTLRSSVEFNQVLSVAYMEGMGMRFHSDGEVGLGDVVASLSLGSPARMSFRLRSKPGKGTFDHSNITKEDYEHWFDHACRSCRKTKPRADEESSAPVQTELMCPTLLTIDIQHGDVFIMIGNTQRFYEHEIERVPGFRIAATCRRIEDVHAHANGTQS